MTESETEYKKQLEAIETEYKKSINKLGFEYAESKRKFEIGDIIKDDTDIIKIDSIGWGKGLSEFPFPIYKGILLTVKLEPKKTGVKNGVIYGNHDNISLVKKSTL